MINNQYVRNYSGIMNTYSGHLNTDSGKSPKNVHIETRMSVQIEPE